MAIKRLLSVLLRKPTKLYEESCSDVYDEIAQYVAEDKNVDVILIYC
jgi:hypothetical protein